MRTGCNTKSLELGSVKLRETQEINAENISFESKELNSIVVLGQQCFRDKLAKNFRSSECIDDMRGVVEQTGELHNDVETVIEFSC